MVTCDINTSEKKEKEVTPVIRRWPAGSSNSFSAHELALLGVEEDDDKCRNKSPPTVEETDNSSRSDETDTASVPSTASASDSGGQSNADAAIHWRGFSRLLKFGSGMRFQTFPPLKGVPKLTRRKSRRIRGEFVPALNSALDTDSCYFKSTWKNFALAELQDATSNFSRENLIGEGGYAEVYKGQLPDGQLVAIKRLTRGSPEEMTMDYLSELGIIVHVDHPNIAKMIGYGVEGGMHLVLQLSPHGSLASLLYGPKEKLDWGIRYKIALGTAEGLFYLHEGCQRRIIHKDIKASNILLTEDFEAQISDFGLAKWLPDKWTHHTVSKVEGTFGYLPPEFFLHGIVDEKTDVYAYGVLLLELITGRQALDSAQRSVVMWAKPLISKNSFKELVDPTLASSYDSEQLSRLVLTASMCISQDSTNRPQMGQACHILKGDESGLEMVKQQQQQQKSELERTYSAEVLDAEEYNSTNYLNDLNRHMEVVLGDCND
ncbi:Pkinase domain-containing protein, partial [Cephalotus follicularis]